MLTSSRKKPGPRRGSIKFRFWKNVEKTPQCWIWHGKLDRKNYGMMYVYHPVTDKPMSTGAHRVSWKIHHGDIPHGMLVCHSCDNPKCVNPEHLFLGTYKDNVEDMDKKGRRRTISMPGELNPSAKLTEAQVSEIRALYATGKVSQETLSKLFGVAQSSISRVVLNKTFTQGGGG